VVVDPGRREQRGVHRVIGMVMAEHHVRHVPGGRAVPGQRRQRIRPGAMFRSVTMLTLLTRRSRSGGLGGRPPRS
jgi:hypothetical protein